MNKYDQFYEEACSEAREVINGWMNEKLRDELHVNESSGEKWHEDTDVFLKRFLTTEKKSVEPEIDFYQENESEVVNKWLDNVQSKLTSFTLPDYEAAEKKKKPIGPKDPRLAMEIRQQKVREARAKREEKMKQRLQRNMEKKQSEAIAREIVKQEAIEKAHKAKLEEEAIQKEMVKIRKQMLDLKRQHQLEVDILPDLHPTSSSIQISKNRDKGCSSTEKNSNQRSTSETTAEIDFYHNQQQLENIKRFKVFQQQKAMRKCFHHWIKIVLSKRAAMGKAKALADWHLLLKTWSAWRKNFFEETTFKDAQRHKERMKQMKIFDHVANNKHRFCVMKKCFMAWKKFVKTEQYAKELLKEQEDTKKKMNALLGFVQSKAVSTNSDLILQTVEDEDLFEEDNTHSSTTQKSFPQKHSKSTVTKQSVPKHAWQVRKRDVQNLTVKQIENIGGHSAASSDLTRVKKVKPNQVSALKSNDRIKASKDVIAQQREMITQQKQIIEEQKRLLEERDGSDKESVVPLANTSSATTSKVRLIQPPKRPKSLLAMEKRAQERVKRREELQERKRQAEIEKVEKLKREEEEEKRKEEEEKKRKQEEIKRLKQLEIEKENQRKVFIAKMQQLRHKAEEHYKSTIMRKYGLRPWLKLRKDVEEKTAVARFHFDTKLSQKVLVTWFEFEKADRGMKEAKALKLYRNILKRRCFRNWLKYGEAMSILEKKADIHFNRLLLHTYLRKWENYVTDERLAYFSKEEQADEHNIKRLKTRGFKILCAFKQNIKREQLRSQRVADMRRKVAQLLPDFDPEISHDAL